jgi:hypothetical protein
LDATGSVAFDNVVLLRTLRAAAGRWRTTLRRQTSGALLLGLAVSLSACTYSRTPNFAVEAPKFRLPPDYRQKIVAWTKRYYAEPDSVRFLGITDPVPVLTTGGAAMWFVCAELDARERGGPYMGPRRIAFAVHPELFSAPMERNKVDVQNEDCDDRRLAWRAWPSRETSARRRR